MNKNVTKHLEVETKIDLGEQGCQNMHTERLESTGITVLWYVATAIQIRSSVATE